MTEAQLKACPFCGSQAGQPEDVSVKYFDGTANPNYGPWWQIMCLNDDCRAWRADASPELVAAKWNKRAGDREPAMTQTPAISTLASSNGSALTLELGAAKSNDAHCLACGFKMIGGANVGLCPKCGSGRWYKTWL